ncbi:hypothetical protein M427DRAFT_141478 [Gonapodya prolifera JEL478]|uniref:RING-type domain-containing protein n=1 Tax=Gonapodya prolifera (strain JEL478) TaxID=1344416 RepID=A0A138ZX45_GONPJ|nr:hypothetical protein M427DRAFT_141478 [Gonapodya prolifera JEL478]|eukprot:KXS09068.1 hypothetical protein M427DRAFT_141478 [Gonapodya prolifera JEL478]
MPPTPTLTSTPVLSALAALATVSHTPGSRSTPVPSNTPSDNDAPSDGQDNPFPVSHILFLGLVSLLLLWAIVSLSREWVCNKISPLPDVPAITPLQAPPPTAHLDAIAALPTRTYEPILLVAGSGPLKSGARLSWISQKARRLSRISVRSEPTTGSPSFFAGTSKDGSVLGEDGPLCAICLEEFDKGVLVKALPCKHEYHVACIDPWLIQVSPSCPMCKQSVLSESSAGEAPEEYRVEQPELAPDPSEQVDTAATEMDALQRGAVQSQPALERSSGSGSGC